MTEPLVSVADYEARLPEPLTFAERQRATLLLQDASDLIREEVGPAVAIPSPAPFVVRQLVMDIAGRVFSNPKNITTEIIGDYSYSLARSALNGMSLTPDEREALYRCLGVPSMASAPMTFGPCPDTVRRFTPIGWADGEDITWAW